MRLHLAMLIVALAARAADARPLPKGMKVFAKDQKLFVEQNGLVVPMVDAEVQDAQMFDHVKSAALSDDGATIVVAVDTCAGGDEPTEIPLASVEARLENALGMRAHVKKKYDDAIAHFTIAATKAPEQPMYATNLLSAQSLASKLADADQTLTTYGPKHVAWFAWRLAVDPELKNVAGRPPAKALAAATPTKLGYKALGDAVAVSPLGLVAVSEWTFFGGPGAPGGEDLAIYDLEGGAPVLRLPVVALEDACEGGAEMEGAPPCTKPQRARTAAHVRAADRVLAALGFAKRPTAWIDAEDGATKLVSPDKATSVVITDDQARVARGKASIVATIEADPRKVGFAGDLVVFQYRQNAFMGCSGDAQRSYSIAVRVK